jgi:hypothetical protein
MTIVQQSDKFVAESQALETRLGEGSGRLSQLEDIFENFGQASKGNGTRAKFWRTYVRYRSREAELNRIGPS